MKLLVEIEDVSDWRACEKALRLTFKTIVEYHRERFAKNIIQLILGEDEDKWDEGRRFEFDRACMKFPHADLRLVLEYCAMDKPSKQGLAKMLAKRNRDLPQAEKYARGSTGESALLQQIKRVFRRGGIEEIAAGPPALRASYLRHCETCAKAGVQSVGWRRPGRRVKK